MYHVPAIVVFNKIDLYGEKEWEVYNQLKAVYETVGYRVFPISIQEGKGLEEVREQLKDKVTLISGHSGVGKSTFINAVMPGINIRTQDVSGWSGKGQHTTTFAEMYDLPFGGQLIDTPGMREFGTGACGEGRVIGLFSGDAAAPQRLPFQ
jgi:ribosome biogenesis GTPase